MTDEDINSVWEKFKTVRDINLHMAKKMAIMEERIRQLEALLIERETYAPE